MLDSPVELVELGVRAYFIREVEHDCPEYLVRAGRRHFTYAAARQTAEDLGC